MSRMHCAPRTGRGRRSAPVRVYRSADFQSAVSPICNRQGTDRSQDGRFCQRAAGCKPAVQQTSSLRYERRQHGKKIGALWLDSIGAQRRQYIQTESHRQYIRIRTLPGKYRGVLSTPFHKYDHVCCVAFRFWRGTTREHPPQWGCDRGVTKPEPKSDATLRAAVLFGPDVVARSLQTPEGYARRSRLVRAKNPSPQTWSYL